jgi:membrane protein DedA with SNARE-associated domain
MILRARKAVGTVGFVLWLIIYSLVAMAVGGRFVVGSHMLLELAYFIAAVIPWLIGAMIIIRWMSKPDPVEPN